MKKRNEIEQKEKHKDLEKFEETYTKAIKEFLGRDTDTKIVFLNADYGWGKTTFIKENLQVPENCIYSPWLNKSENYIEELYYTVTEANKPKTTFIVALIIIVLFITNAFFSGNILGINPDVAINYIKTNVKIELIIFIAALLLIGFIIYLTNHYIELIYLSNKKNYINNLEEKIIEKFLTKIDNVLVIEDIDRIDDIEEILITANKISEVIKKKNRNQYILLTGDYNRIINRINSPQEFSNFRDALIYESRGLSITDKVISLVIGFPTKKERLNNILEESKIDIDIKEIEKDEIISFMEEKALNVRFFNTFLEEQKQSLKETASIYIEFNKYYKKTRLVNVNEGQLSTSVFNLKNFPSCLNDYELLLEKETIEIGQNQKYTLQTLLDTKENLDEINQDLLRLISENSNEILQLFKKFYGTQKYPQNANNQKRDYLYKEEKLKQFLIGHYKEELEYDHRIKNKRCYFDIAKNNDKGQRYFSQNDYLDETVSKEEFNIAYMIFFFSKNIDQIKEKYPCLFKMLSEKQKKIKNNIKKRQNKFVIFLSLKQDISK